MTAINTIGREPGKRVRRHTTRGRDRARMRALILFVVLLLTAAVAVWLVVRSEKSTQKPAAAPCTGQSGGAGAIKLRVLNATSREGLAASVAAQLRKRGYMVTAIGNDARSVTGSAEVRHGAKGWPAARAIATTVAGSTLRKDTRAGTDVDLVLGTNFRALVPAKPGAAANGCPVTAKTTGSPRPT